MTVQRKPEPAGLGLLDLHGGLPGKKIDWLESLRRNGADAFRAAGLPNRKVEAWKYTDLAALTKAGFTPDAEPAPVDKASLNALEFGRQSNLRLVFVNGRYREDLSTIPDLPEGVTISPFTEVIQSKVPLVKDRLGSLVDTGAHPLAALNTALMTDGMLLHVQEDVVMEDPVEILWVGAGGAEPPLYHTRNLILAEAGSRVTLVEHHVGLCIGSYFSNQVTEIFADDRAIVRHCKVQAETEEAFHVALTKARVGKDAMYDSFSFSTGGKVSRNEIRVLLDAPGADCRLNGAYMMKGEQHCDNTTFIDHAHPETTSKELYKGVLDGKSRGVFQGKITVRPGAQKADGQQMNRALLLSDTAEIDSKPELEIYADDVQCAHGATAGELDESALFYLCSRGIPETEARRILIEAFLNEVIDGIALAGMRSTLEHNISRWMGSR